MTALDLKAARAAILSAKCPEDIFGDLAEPRDVALGRAFRQLVVTVHPDRYATDATLQGLAKEAFERLGELKAQAAAKIGAGTYGKRHVPPPATPAPKPGPITIRSGKSVFCVGDLIARGDVCDVYQCEADGKPAALKIAQHASVNDLAENEANTLRKIHEAVPTEQERIARFVPKLEASFMLSGKPARRVNVLPLFADLVSLAEVKSAFPGGLDFRDVVWMFKRALMVLGFTHRRGFVHGAVLPPHLLVHPIEHSACLIDWSYAVPLNGRIKAISSSHRGFYPEEILNKQPVTPATDIYMLARCVIMMLGVGLRSDIPPRLTAFLQGCILRKPAHRPQDAWALHDELDALLKRLIGPPKYRPLIMPAAAGGR